MRHIAVAVPAHLAALGLLLHIAQATRFYEFLVQLCMTTNTVIHYHLTCQRLSHRSLTFCVGHEICRVLQSVHRLEAILQGEVLMRHMTIVTRSITSMRGVTPRGIVRRHDVAVHAGRWIITHKIGMRTKQIHKQSAKSANHTCYNQQPHLLAIGKQIFQC